MDVKSLDKIMHDINSSLATLKVANLGIQRYLPILLEGYSKAITHNLIGNEFHGSNNIELFKDVLGNMEISLEKISLFLKVLEQKIHTHKFNDF